MRNAGGMDLGETRIGKKRAFFISAIGGSHVAAARVGREIKNISVTSGGEHDRVGRDVVDLTSPQISREDSFDVSIYENNVALFGLEKHLHRAGGDLVAESLITDEPKL